MLGARQLNSHNCFVNEAVEGNYEYFLLLSLFLEVSQQSGMNLTLDCAQPSGVQFNSSLMTEYFCPYCRESVAFSEKHYHEEKESHGRSDSTRFSLNFLGLSIGRLLGEVVMWILRSVYFREVTVIGKENIPPAGAAVFYGNHQNQFIDPLMMNSYVHRKVRFLMAQKSLSQPIIGTLGRMFESVPVIRPQDVRLTSGRGYLTSIEGCLVTGEGTSFTDSLNDGDVVAWQEGGTLVRAQVKKVIDNTSLQLTVPKVLSSSKTEYSTSHRIDQSAMYTKVYETLEKEQCIGIFPEGGSHDQTSLLPLKAGVAMFSLGAAERGINVKVVPVGLTYLHGHKFRSRAYVEVGVPLTPPPDLVELYKTDKRQAIAQFLTQLQGSLKAVTINAADYSTLKFLHDFRQLYQPLNCFLPPQSYLRLIRRLALIVESERDCQSFQEFRKNVENYALLRNNLYLQDSQVATLKNLNPDLTVKHFNLLVRRVFTVIMLVSVLFPFLVIGVPLGCCIEHFATKKTRRAVAESTVKIVGADVKGSFRIMMSFFFFPLGILVAACGVFFVSNFRAATAVFFSLPMALYVSLLVFQEAIIECKATLPLILTLFSFYHKRYQKLYQLRKSLASQARTIVLNCDPMLVEEMERHLKKDADNNEPSLFSIRHSIRRRYEMDGKLL